MTARLVVYHRAPTDDPLAVERAYRLFLPGFRPTPGVLGVALLRLAGDPYGYAVVTDWQDADAYESWRQGPAHQQRKTPLRPYQDRRRTPCYELYEVLDTAPAPGRERTVGTSVPGTVRDTDKEHPS
ncbi:MULTISPECIES: antibiotic biosynthesis monooxygenase family protein [Streptomyces]|uniref:antibiotic biosynthesis monooxygenase family protein n=1 Tax=Streptomyces TaxID=1883 RepID=UPI001E3D9BCE|nr:MULTISPECIES: antibiotic biosynthesis monooxygenase family protein [Streptomyces]UFQ18600.1 antibiotic biosynthesis monooxygenase [Streptomyces huasconensis]WCL88215.1 antibiotic biosynthesis monooxygenase [Streptomyces sp. JCM 35825]